MTKILRSGKPDPHCGSHGHGALGGAAVWERDLTVIDPDTIELHNLGEFEAARRREVCALRPSGDGECGVDLRWITTLSPHNPQVVEFALG